MNTTLNNVHEGKYGFHPCDKETYRKLKKVKYYQHLEEQQQAAWERWNAKQPQNRVRWLFAGLTPSQGGLSNAFGDWRAVPWEKPETCPVNLVCVLGPEWNNARPKKSADLVRPMKISIQTLDSLIEQADAWVARIENQRKEWKRSKEARYE